MRVFAQVKFLGSEKMSFTDKEGNYVEYYENDIRGDGGVITVNSKNGFEESVGHDGVAEFEASALDKGYKLTLKGFVRGGSLPEAEDEIE